MKSKILIIIICIVSISIGTYYIIQWKKLQDKEQALSQQLVVEEKIDSKSESDQKDTIEIPVFEKNIEFVSNQNSTLNVELKNSERTPTRPICIGEGCNGSMSGADDYTAVRIPLITQGGTIGCGSKIIFAPHAVAKTAAIIDATYRTLFELQENSDIPEDNIRNVVAGYTQLFYDSVTLQNGIAKLYLTGTMYGPGHCAESDMKAQIEQSALQFDTVNKLEVYINNEIFNWCSLDMSNGEGSCPEQPKLWIVEK